MGTESAKICVSNHFWGFSCRFVSNNRPTGFDCDDTLQGVSIRRFSKKVSKVQRSTHLYSSHHLISRSCFAPLCVRLLPRSHMADDKKMLTPYEETLLNALRREPTGLEMWKTVSGGNPNAKHREITSMLLFAMDTCTKLEAEFWADWGTLLGALRVNKNFCFLCSTFTLTSKNSLQHFATASGRDSLGLGFRPELPNG